MVKRWIQAAVIVASSAALLSCATIEKPIKNTDSSIAEPQDLPLSNPEQPDKNAEGKVTKKDAKTLAVQDVVNRQEQEFRQLLSDLTLKPGATPKTTVAGKDFAAPFTVTAENGSGAIAGLDLTFSWPAARSADVVSYDTVQITTDENGRAAFLPETPDFAVSGMVTVFPTPVNSSPAIVQLAYDASVELPYKVKSKLASVQGMLYAFDFDDKQMPTANSFKLLQHLRNSGVNVGNAPISDPSYCAKPLSELYKATYDIVGAAYKFMVAATFKYAEPPTVSDGLTTVHLTAEITCIGMSDGSELCRIALDETVTDKSKQAADQKCRERLAARAAEEIIFNM